MKLILAIIQPSKLEAVKEALAKVEVFRLTVIDVQGFGRQKGHAEVYRGHELTVNLPTGVPIEPLNVDLSTLSAATDVVLGFGDPVAEVVDLNFQSGPDRDLDSRILLYAAALYHRYGVPVRSLLILLRPAAHSP